MVIARIRPSPRLKENKKKSLNAHDNSGRFGPPWSPGESKERMRGLVTRPRCRPLS